MALDFPTSPTVGQIYGNYIWTGTVWDSTANQALTLNTGPTVASSTARDAMFPSPVPGNSVWRSDTEQTERYYAAKGSPARAAGWYSGQDGGLVPIVPGSISLGSGSATCTGNGLITLTSVGTIGIDSVFTSAYRDYFIQYNVLGASTMTLAVRLRASGTTAAGASTYGMGRMYQTNATVGGQNNAWADAWGLVPDARAKNWGTINLYRPQLATYTNIHQHAIVVSGETDVTSMNQQFGFGMHNQATSYDGLYFYNGGGVAMTGTIQIFGIRN